MVTQSKEPPACCQDSVQTDPQWPWAGHLHSLFPGPLLWVVGEASGHDTCGGQLQDWPGPQRSCDRLPAAGTCVALPASEVNVGEPGYPPEQSVHMSCTLGLSGLSRDVRAVPHTWSSPKSPSHPSLLLSSLESESILVLSLWFSSPNKK